MCDLQDNDCDSLVDGADPDQVGDFMYYADTDGD